MKGDGFFVVLSQDKTSGSRQIVIDCFLFSLRGGAPPLYPPWGLGGSMFLSHLASTDE